MAETVTATSRLLWLIMQPDGYAGAEFGDPELSRLREETFTCLRKLVTPEEAKRRLSKILEALEEGGKKE